MPPVPVSVPIRFALYADTSGGELACWPWTGATNEDGYGLLHVDGRVERAHRIALALAGRPAPSAIDVLHECDNPPCVNPRHLHHGTALENMAEARARGRTNRGERNGTAKLTATDVTEMRRLRAAGASYDELCDRYGVGKSTVSRIILRRAWTHV